MTLAGSLGSFEGEAWASIMAARLYTMAIAVLITELPPLHVESLSSVARTFAIEHTEDIPRLRLSCITRC